MNKSHSSNDPQVPLDAITQANTFEITLSLWISNQAREISGREYAQLKRMLR
jgi:hypothetical protein